MQSDWMQLAQHDGEDKVEKQVGKPTRRGTSTDGPERLAIGAVHSRSNQTACKIDDHRRRARAVPAVYTTLLQDFQNAIVALGVNPLVSTYGLDKMKSH